MATKGGPQWNLLITKDECKLAIFSGLALEESLADLLELLSNNRQHFDTDTIELIEAGPSTLLAET